MTTAHQTQTKISVARCKFDQSVHVCGVFDLMKDPFPLACSNTLLCCFSALLQFIESGDQRTWKGEVLAFAMLATVVLYMTAVGRFCYHGYNCGMNLRTIVTGMVYRKVQARIHRLATFFFLFFCVLF